MCVGAGLEAAGEGFSVLCVSGGARGGRGSVCAQTSECTERVVHTHTHTRVAVNWLAL